MTHEEKLLTILSQVYGLPQHSNKVVDATLMLDIVNALKDKVILREELLTEDEIFKILCENNKILCMKEISKIIHEAQNKKAGLV